MANKGDNIFVHVLIRVMILFFLFFISIPIAESTLNPNRRCTTGDVFAIIFFCLISLLLWILGLMIESIFLHMKGKIRKRNSNFVMAGIPTVLLIYIVIANNNIHE